MLSAVIAGAAVMQAFAMRPEAQAGSSIVARLAQTMHEHPSDEMAVITEASSIVNNIMLEAGNATEHLRDEDQKLLRDVMTMIRDTMFGSMKGAHSDDKVALEKAIQDILDCNSKVAALQSPTGLLGELKQAAVEAQKELDRLGGDKETKTAANNSAWTKFQTHMEDGIGDAPPCPPLPEKTMPSLDVYFEQSRYKVWFSWQQPIYFEQRELWKTAHAALREAIRAYEIQQAKLDIHYCDWERELQDACGVFDDCFEETSAHYSKILSPRVRSSMDRRIAAYKAGETLLVQIEFLLAMRKSSEVGSVDASAYRVEFPSLPERGECNLSVLDSAQWNPPINCKEHQDVNCGEHFARSCDYCPQDQGAAWCNGQCEMKDGQCAPRDEDVVLRHREYGITVARGPDWRWGPQDKPAGSHGVTFRGPGKKNEGWIWVKWPNRHRNRYRIGLHGKYDLIVVEGGAASEIQEVEADAEALLQTQNEAV